MPLHLLRLPQRFFRTLAHGDILHNGSNSENPSAIILEQPFFQQYHKSGAIFSGIALLSTLGWRKVTIISL